VKSHLASSSAVLLVALAVPAASSAPTDDLPLLEAAVRWGLTQTHVDGAHNVYLQIEAGDPPAELMARLSDLTVLRPVSECPHREAYGKSWPDPPTGSVVLNVWDVVRKSKSVAVIRIGHSEGPTSGMACQEFFERQMGGWMHRARRNNETQECGVA